MIPNADLFHLFHCRFGFTTYRRYARPDPCRPQELLGTKCCVADRALVQDPLDRCDRPTCNEDPHVLIDRLIAVPIVFSGFFGFGNIFCFSGIL